MSNKESEQEISETKNQIERILSGQASSFDERWVPRAARRRHGSKEVQRRAMVVALDLLNRADKDDRLGAALDEMTEDADYSVRQKAVAQVAVIRLLFPKQSGPTEYRLGCALKFARDRKFTPKQFYVDMEVRGGYTGYVDALKGTEASKAKSARALKPADGIKRALQKRGAKQTSEGSGLHINRDKWLVALGRRKKTNGRIEYYSFRAISDASLLKLVKLFPELKGE